MTKWADSEAVLAEIAQIVEDKNQTAIPRLIAWLEHPAEAVKLAAIAALGQLKAIEAIPVLRGLLDRPEARAALAQIDPSEMRRGLVMRAQNAFPGVEVSSSETVNPDVQFSTYYPSEIRPETWMPLTAYIFKSSAAEAVIADAQRVFGGTMAIIRRMVESAQRVLPIGTVITATPDLAGVQFNPPQITIGFFEDWHRLEFKFRALPETPIDQAVNGTLNFTVEGVIVADIPLSVFVSATAESLTMTTMTQKLYKAIFCSYSRRDTAIVERVEKAYRALGFDFLRDVQSIKSGQDWDDQLYALIEQADIFQLFWSHTARESEWVEREWRYALGLDRNTLNFIRPVYWQQPIPPVPPELGHIHFAYEPGLDDEIP
ncbi:MAG: TIR domain-containing protein [Anaerolineae bacterium]|jgi:hypothetical protein|nr:TIR domain-containing protein [Anaerolineae bacterium]